ncbi:MAG: glycosyl hydrolase 2 galactose-binding domain-containing protein [Streptosporangiales bacterium]
MSKPGTVFRLQLTALVAGATLCALALPAAPAWGVDRPGDTHSSSTFAGTSDLTTGWKIQSSAKTTGAGGAISDPGYATSGWLPISKPETLMAGLIENGRYPDIFHSDNLASVPTKQFDVPWWYRDELTIHPRPGQHTFLIMNGVASRANLWVNGTKIADKSKLQGSYSRFEFDIGGQVRNGRNAIALEVYPNDSDKYLTMDMVDWNHPSPDGYTGLQFTPQLAQDGAVSVRNAHVVQDNAKDLSSSSLTVKADVRNNTGDAQRSVVSASITHRHTRITVRRTASVRPHSTRTVTFTPAHHHRLVIHHPDVWWPYQLGDQPMYHLSVRASAGRGVSDTDSDDFGIRTVTSHLTHVVPGKTFAPKGYRKFVINGVPLVIRGGGWSQDMFLRYSPSNIHDQLSYIKNMGLNAIRFEGNFPPENMFDQMDRAGILAMAGWQCCDKWEQDSSDWSKQIKANAANQASHVARWLRDHPSVFTFYQGSDQAPDPAKERIYLKAFRSADWQVPQVASAEYKASPKLGVSGSKEGPYNYVPPVYWWDNGPETKGGGSAFTNAGGAWGYDTEVSAGNTIPTQDSLNRFLTAADQKQVWDTSSTHGPGSGPTIYHTSPYNDYTTIARLGQYNTPLWHRYGHWSDMASYQKLAQVGEYEAARAQFEAYLGNSKNRANPSTGVIYWQMNKAWPSLQWSLYGYDMDQSGVYFGAKKAGEPVHIMYSYADGSVRVANLTRHRQGGLRARAEVFDIDGKRAATSDSRVPPLASQGVRTVLKPHVPNGISTTYFLKLTLSRGQHAVSRNVYWLSTKHDQVDWQKTLGEGHGATFKPGGYADLTGLQDLQPVSVRATATTVRRGGDEVTRITIRNVSDHRTPAFFTRADVRRGTSDGTPLAGDNQVLPIRWNDNDITIWPGESRTLTARYSASDLRGASPVVSLHGWNVAARTIPAGPG